MKRASLLIELLLLAAGAFFAIASSHIDSFTVRDSDDTWIAANVFEGQTAFPVDGAIDLNIGYADFATDSTVEERAPVPAFDDDVPYTGDDEDGITLAQKALEQITLFRTDTATSVALDIEIRTRTARITPVTPLASNASYNLRFNWLDEYATVARPIPDHIIFSTRPIIQVRDMWQNDETTIIEFSAPLDPESVMLASSSVDFLWMEDNQTYAVAGDTNPADYTYDVQGHLLLIAPLSFLEPYPTWLRIGPSLTGLQGEQIQTTDVQIEDEFETGTITPVAEEGMVILPINWSQLVPCQVRDDVAEPCITLSTEMLIHAVSAEAEQW